VIIDRPEQPGALSAFLVVLLLSWLVIWSLPALNRYLERKTEWLERRRREDRHQSIQETAGRMGLDPVKLEEFVAELEQKKPEKAKPEEVEPDWTRKCFVCGATPIVPLTEMCGPCTFGVAKTFGGNW
jgi:hypothetical protein